VLHEVLPQRLSITTHPMMLPRHSGATPRKCYVIYMGRTTDAVNLISVVSKTISYAMCCLCAFLFAGSCCLELLWYCCNIPLDFARYYTFWVSVHYDQHFAKFTIWIWILVNITIIIYHAAKRGHCEVWSKYLTMVTYCLLPCHKIIYAVT
jgi:hypothetical protein